MWFGEGYFEFKDKLSRPLYETCYFVEGLILLLLFLHREVQIMCFLFKNKTK